MKAAEKAGRPSLSGQIGGTFVDNEKLVGFRAMIFCSHEITRFSVSNKNELCIYIDEFLLLLVRHSAERVVVAPEFSCGFGERFGCDSFNLSSLCARADRRQRDTADVATRSHATGQHVLRVKVSA